MAVLFGHLDGHGGRGGVVGLELDTLITIANRSEDYAHTPRHPHARQAPLFFLQLCRLRDPTFARSLAGKPADAAHSGDLERNELALTDENEDLVRERDELARSHDDLEKRLARAPERASESSLQRALAALLHAADPTIHGSTRGTQFASAFRLGIPLLEKFGGVFRVFLHARPRLESSE